MARIDENFLHFSKEYLFSKVEAKVSLLRREKPLAPLLNLGVGDVALPLAPSIAKALIEGTREMEEKVFGYGPTKGYLFLREKILEMIYPTMGFSPDEIFVSEGIVRDICDIQELFAKDAVIGIMDPTYPAYKDTALLAGRKVVLLPCLEENGFLPLPPKTPLDVVYLCSPNNPTGVAFTKDLLRLWVDWAERHQTILLIDAAYEAFISSTDVPKTIYEIEGAKHVAIEFRSFSKSAGFTGLRLGYTVIPKELKSLQSLWLLRQDIKTNGLSYPIQRAGFASLFGEGKTETELQVAAYKEHAKDLRHHLQSLGHTTYGGEDSPYIWWKIESKDSWDFFDYLLYELHIISIPGKGFGPSGEGFMRLSSFITKNTLDRCKERLCHMK